MAFAQLGHFFYQFLTDVYNNTAPDSYCCEKKVQTVIFHQEQQNEQLSFILAELTKRKCNPPPSTTYDIGNPGPQIWQGQTV